MSVAQRKVERLPEAATVELITQYQRASALLQALIAGAVRREALGTQREREAQLSAVRSAIASLKQQTKGLGAAAVQEAYVGGAGIADESIKLELPSVASNLLIPKFAGGANRRQVQALQLGVEGRLAGALTAVGRQADDVFRRVGLEAVGTGIAAGLERRKTSAQLSSRLGEEGISAFVDKAGRNWKLGVYSSMAVRTTQRQAVSLGTVDRMTQVGLDLVTVSKHVGSCAICRPFEGRTFTLSGKIEGYELLEHPPPFHPNCRHVIYAAAANLQMVLANMAAAA
jgi:hypothetical protein